MKMEKNVGKTDKIIRFVIAAVLLLLNLTGALSGVLAAAAWVVILIALFTGIAGWCGLYAALGTNTCPIKKDSGSIENK